MRVWKNVLGVIFIGIYLAFFSISWINALSDTTYTRTNLQVLGTNTMALPQNTGLPDLNQILSLTNQARLNEGSQLLTLDDRLIQVAQQRADSMASVGYYAHQSPSGKYFFDDLKNTGFQNSYSCENLGLDSSTSANTYMSQWLLSTKGHKQCLLNKQTLRVGYGVARLSFDQTTAADDSFVVVAIHAAPAK